MQKRKQTRQSPSATRARSGGKWPSDGDRYAALAIATLIGFVWVLCGCTPTIRPGQVESSAPSWDGNEQNSGFIGFDAEGNGIITPRAEARYFYLCELYGWEFRPPALGNEPIPTVTNTFILDAQHLAQFAVMNRWKKEGRPPLTSK